MEKIDFELKENKKLHIALQKQYSEKIIREKYGIGQPGKTVDTPIDTKNIDTILQYMFNDVYIERKSETHPSNNLTLELIANIDKNSKELEKYSLGVPFSASDTDLDYLEALTFSAKKDKKNVKHSLGLMSDCLPEAHITQFVRARIDRRDKNNEIVLSARMYLFDTNKLQQFVKAHIKDIKLTFDNKNANHTCLCALVPLDFIGLESTLVYRDIDIFNEFVPAYKEMLLNIKMKEIKERTFKGLEELL